MNSVLKILKDGGDSDKKSRSPIVHKETYLREDVARLPKQASDVRFGSSALDKFYKSQRVRCADKLANAPPVELPLTAIVISQLERRILGIEADRATHRERLRDVGISDIEIDCAVLVKPRPEDGGQLFHKFREYRARLEHLRNFGCSKPPFDATMHYGNHLSHSAG